MFAAKTGMSSTRSVVMVSASVISEAYPISKISSKMTEPKVEIRKIQSGRKNEKTCSKAGLLGEKTPFFPPKVGHGWGFGAEGGESIPRPRAYKNTSGTFGRPHPK